MAKAKFVESDVEKLTAKLNLLRARVHRINFEMNYSDNENNDAMFK